MIGERNVKGTIKVKKLYEDSIVPQYANLFATGADLFAHIPEEITILPGETIMIGTGIAIQTPVNYTTLTVARSGISTKRDLAPANKIGVIDCDYRGEVFIPLHNHGNKSQTISPNERIAQMIIIETPRFVIDVVNELDKTERGTNGFGSTGR